MDINKHEKNWTLLWVGREWLRATKEQMKAKYIYYSINVSGKPPTEANNVEKDLRIWLYDILANVMLHFHTTHSFSGLLVRTDYLLCM